MSEKFETGAKTHAVNDLILFTDTTERLAILRDSIYEDWFKHGSYGTSPLMYKFEPLIRAAKAAYRSEFPNDSTHIASMPKAEDDDYMNLYMQEYPDWKEENYGLRFIEVTYSDGDVCETAMAHGLSDEEMLNYFAVGNIFNRGSVDDDLQTVVSRRILK